MRLLFAVAACACGGFNTPPQQAAVGLALSAAELPPRVAKDGHLLLLAKLDATVAVSARGSEKETLLQASRPFSVELTERWTALAEGELLRGDYDKVKLELQTLAVTGIYDGAEFRVEANGPLSFELSCEGWRVELGTLSTVSLVADPKTWMATEEGGQLEPLAPSDERASAELLSRFVASLTAVRDDNRDGVEDPERH